MKFVATGTMIFKWIVAHIAGFGGLGYAVYLVSQKDYQNAMNALLAAMAGFGVAFSPRVQAVLDALKTAQVSNTGVVVVDPKKKQ